MSRRLTRRTWAALAILLLAIPALMAVFVCVWDERKYYLTSLLLVGLMFVPFVLRFEGRRPQARELVLLATMTALAVAGRAAFYWLPQCKPVCAIVILTAVAFTPEAGFVTGAAAGLISNFFFGQGPWTPWQMLGFGLVGFLGGVLFAVFTCLCYVTGIAEFEFDDILKEVCMVMFFTSVGFQANLKVLKSGGKAMIVFLGVVIVLIVSQNFIAVGLASLLQVDPLVGLCTGSIPMVGGHGTAGAFGPVLEDFGISGATTLCTAAATYGLIAGSMIGGPIGRRLIEKHKLLDTVVQEDDSLLVEEEIKHERHASMYPSAVFQLIIAIGIGTVVSKLLSLTGMTFPIYIGAMIAAACMRNIGEYTGKITIYMGEINDIGGISLSLFLGIAMITLKLWQLAELALPLLILLAGQTLLMFVFTNFIVFRVMGRDYDAAVISSGVCGFGMGATPNAMANMQALCEKYAPSVKAYLLIPLVGSLFADFINSLVTTFFINFI